MEELRKKYSSLTNLLTSSSNLVIFFLLGLILIGFGVLTYKTDAFSSGDKVEILNLLHINPQPLGWWSKYSLWHT